MRQRDHAAEPANLNADDLAYIRQKDPLAAVVIEQQMNNRKPRPPMMGGAVQCV